MPSRMAILAHCPVRLSLAHTRGIVRFGVAFIAPVLALAGIIGTTGCGMAQSGGSSGQPAPSSLSASSSAVSFGNVTVGSPASQTVVLTDAGPGNVTISGLAVTGGGFTMTGGAPATLTPNQSITVSLSFAPKAAGSAQGTLSVLSNAANSSMDISLTGTGVAASSQLKSSSTSVSFGSLTLGNSAVQTVTLTDSGTASVAISSISASGSGFTVSGGANVTLTPNGSVTVSVTFNPTAVGNATGTLTVASNATNPSLTVGLSGAAVAASKTHKVALNWQPSESAVIGYYIYRGLSATGLTKLTGINPSASYTDTTVASGTTYFYAVTSVDANNVESTPSNQVSVQIPN